MNSGLDIVMQIIIFIVLLSIALWVFMVRRSAKLNNRFKNFSIESMKDDTPAIFDIVKSYYLKIRKSVSLFLEKTKIFDTYSKKYQKYCNVNLKEKPMDYMSDKVISGICLMVLAIVLNVFTNSDTTFLQLITMFLIGFFLVDFYLTIKSKIRKKRIDNDMLKAIIIMNNAFQSGLSIMQAIYTVYHELDGPISEEFRKMYIDLTFGLTTEAAFERFNERVDNKEARYITTSLNVLNKTGGNIVQVFSSVERNSFTRKKLADELKSLSASAKAIFRILVVIPVLLFVVIILMNPSYFNPLLTTGIGLLVLLLCLIIYISYIIIIRKVVKAGVKE